MMRLPIITVSGTLSQTAMVCAELEKRGYRVSEVWKRIDWPYFWRYRWTVIMFDALVVVDAIQRAQEQTLEEKLKAAIEREDYEEAARLRGLMKDGK